MPGKYATIPSLIGGKVFLKPMSADDTVNVHYWTQQFDPQSLLFEAVPISTAATAVEERKKNGSSTWEQNLAIVRKEDNVLVGEIAFFNTNRLNRSTQLRIIIDPDEQKNGFAADALKVLTTYLVKFRDINRIWVCIPENCKGGIKLFESLQFKKEGTMRDHHFFDGEFHQAFIYSLLRFEIDW